MDPLRLGQSARAHLTWAFDRVSTVWKLCLLNNDESGSMQGQLHQNALAFDRVSALGGGRFDAVLVHGFGSDSAYHLFATPVLAEVLRPLLKVERLRVTLQEVGSDRATVEATRAFLRGRTTHGSTNPASHPRFLEHLAGLLDALPASLELTVVNTSDGGFDGGAPQREIQRQMSRIMSRCRGQVVANVLVGSAGSPSALHFFTGDPEAFDSRLLLSTVRDDASQGVLSLAGLDPASVKLGVGSTSERMTLQPSTSFWEHDRATDDLVAYWTDDVPPPATVTVRRFQPQPGGRELVMASTVTLTPRPVRLESDARFMFALIARCFSDNPYLRDTSRQSLNAMIAQLEPLLATRTDVLRSLTAAPDERSVLDDLARQLDDNLVQIQVTRAGSWSLREMSARMNALNNARRFLKLALRTVQEKVDQQLIDRELAFLSDHPDHWVTWLQPAIDELTEQLSATQQDVGGAMQHLATRIRTQKSREDGRTRSVDRHVEALVARSRARHDRAARASDPADTVPLESPGEWLARRCPITGARLTDGVAGMPFVADRRDLTSGNVAAGAQNVDRLPIARDALLSLEAIRGLMWGTNGQMASPFCTAVGVYNAAIPVLLGPATPARLRDLERAIGWLCTGTSAFEGAMAEALPAALSTVLGPLDESHAQAASVAGDDEDDAGWGRGARPPVPADALDRDQQAHALLRTSALLGHFRSYPYTTGTSVLDESQARQPLPDVWAISLVDTAEFASLQSFGCASSLLGRAVAASGCHPDQVARGLFGWACRNLARSLLGTTATDGRGGVEGVLRLAALTEHDVELTGYPAGVPAVTSEPAARETAPDALPPGTLAAIVGPELSPLWGTRVAPTRTGFVEALNAWLNELPVEQTTFVIERLGGLFERLDRLAPAPEVTGSTTATSAAATATPAATSTPGAPTAEVTGATYQHFSAHSLEAVAPVRASTPAPTVADENVAAHRRRKADETRWVAPRDARLPAGQLSASVRRFLNEHTAMWPLRAFLRLHAAGCVGQPALAALRASREARPFPRVDDVVGALAAMVGGVDEVRQLALRAFAFVVSEANGYADKHWAESPLRTADEARIRSVLELGPVAADDQPAPVHHGPAPWSLPAPGGRQWPRMIGLGYLPKSRAVDAEGRDDSVPYRCTTEEAALTDALLCQKGFHAISEQLQARGALVLPGLHRHARAVLGDHPDDLQALPAPERDRRLREELLPRLAGKVGGDPQHPLFFAHCAIVLRDMVALGHDTRRFTSDEPDAFLHEEAERMRAIARV